MGELVNMGPCVAEVLANDHLFGEFPQRAESPGSPHTEMTDIWVRYGDIQKMVDEDDFSSIASEHDSIWLKDLPAVKRVCFEVMAMVDGERLGGVLITKLPPKGRIQPHVDAGWHAQYYDKYFVPIQNEAGAVFYFEDGELEPNIGEVWQFDNSRTHWVHNESDADRIAMIVCIKQDKFDIGGGLCHGQQQQDR